MTNPGERGATVQQLTKQKPSKVSNRRVALPTAIQTAYRIHVSPVNWTIRYMLMNTLTIGKNGTKGTCEQSKKGSFQLLFIISAKKKHVIAEPLLTYSYHERRLCGILWMSPDEEDTDQQEGCKDADKCYTPCFPFSKRVYGQAQDDAQCNHKSHCRKNRDWIN